MTKAEGNREIKRLFEKELRFLHMEIDRLRNRLNDIERIIQKWNPKNKSNKVKLKRSIGQKAEENKHEQLK